jgi:hypothetical protein
LFSFIPILLTMISPTNASLSFATCSSDSSQLVALHLELFHLLVHI